MKQINLLIKMLKVVLVSTILYSCTDNYKDFNTNKHEVTDPMLDYDNLRVGGFIRTMQLDVIPTSDLLAGEFQLSQNLTGDIFSGYMGAINTWNGNNRYNLPFDNWNDRGFEVGFIKVMPAWKRIMDVTKEEQNKPISYALAQILKVAAMHRLADNYGALPYFQFGTTGITTPYDSLEDIYESFFNDLDEAIALITEFIDASPSARPLAKYDLVYSGDFNKWLKFANSLKLRLAMRTVYVDANKARQRAQEAIASGVMIDNSDNAMLKSGNGITIFNPLKKIWDDYSDTRMGANMDSFLNGYKDGRIGSYFQKSAIATQEYCGVRNGINITNKSDYLPLSSPNINASDPVHWMSAPEIYFLRAEAAIRGWTEFGDAKELYERGVELSHAMWDAALRVDYLSDETSLPAPFIDRARNRNNILATNPLLSKITIAWQNSAPFETKLERIITQKWIAMFPDGQEAWSEFRRTNYPKIFPVVVNNSGGTINTATQIRRVIFPQSEYNNNRTEVMKATALLGGADNGGTKVWWDKK